MKSLLFAAALMSSSIEAIKTNNLLKQNFDSLFGNSTATNDALEQTNQTSSAYAVDQYGNLWQIPDNSLASTASNTVATNYAA